MYLMRFHRGALPRWLCPAAPSLFTMVLLTATACTRNDPGPLRVGINAWPGYEFLYLAHEKGFYRDEGVEVRLLELASLSDVRRAYERGQIDIMGTTVTDVLLIRDQSERRPQIVRVVDASDGADVIVGRTQALADAGLRGARVGVELATVGIYVLARGLEKQGLGLKDVQLVSVDQSNMEEVFRAGDVDAVVTYPPVSLRLATAPQSVTMFSTRDIPGEVLDVIAVEADTAVTRPQDVEAVVRAFDRAVEYARVNREDAYRIMAERENVTPEEFDAVMKEGIHFFSTSEAQQLFQPGGALVATIDRADRILRASGQISGPDLRQGAVNSSFMEAGATR